MVKFLIFTFSFFSIYTQAQFTGNAIPTTLSGKDDAKVLSYFKSVTAKCTLTEPEKTQISRSPNIIYVANCMTAKRCNEKMVVDALTKAANSLCEQKNPSLKAAVVSPVKVMAATSTPVSAPATAAPAAVVAGPAAAPRFVVGPCVGPGDCSGQSAPKPIVYGWQLPVYMYPGITVDALQYAGGFSVYEQPAAKCDASNQGALMTIDFGVDKPDLRGVICGGDPSLTLTDELAKINAQKTTLDKLPSEVAVKKAEYKLVQIRILPLVEGQIRICPGGPEDNYTPVTCTGPADIGKIGGSERCGINKCVRIDGGPIKSTAKKDDKPDTDPVKIAEAVALATKALAAAKLAQDTAAAALAAANRAPATAPAPPQPAYIPYERPEGGGD